MPAPASSEANETADRLVFMRVSDTSGGLVRLSSSEERRDQNPVASARLASLESKSAKLASSLASRADFQKPPLGSWAGPSAQETPEAWGQMPRSRSSCRGTPPNASRPVPSGWGSGLTRWQAPSACCPCDHDAHQIDDARVPDTEDWREMQFHDECFHIWDDDGGLK